MNLNIPCYKCERRYRACHDTCEDYKKFRANKDKENELKRMRTDLVSSHYAKLDKKLYKR